MTDEIPKEIGDAIRELRYDAEHGFPMHADESQAELESAIATALHEAGEEGRKEAVMAMEKLTTVETISSNSLTLSPSPQREPLTNALPPMAARMVETFGPAGGGRVWPHAKPQREDEDLHCSRCGQPMTAHGPRTRFGRVCPSPDKETP